VSAARPFAPLSAYVLHSYAWSESSLILDLYTRDQGRLVVVAKGAKRPYSQMRAVLLPFQRLNVQLARSKTVAANALGSGPDVSDVVNLRSAEWDGAWHAHVRRAGVLTGDALFSGFYLNELLLKTLPRTEAHPEVFDAYALTLCALAHDRELNAQAALRAFELILLRGMGVLPDVSLDSLAQNAVQADADYALVPEWGVVAAQGQRPPVDAYPLREQPVLLPGRLLLAVQAALAANDAPALQQVCLAHLPTFKALLRQWLHYHLAQLGSPALRTRQLLRDAQALQPLKGSP
jgi:DNA repair protein RecO (recombination protein O)